MSLARFAAAGFCVSAALVSSVGIPGPAEAQEPALPLSVTPTSGPVDTRIVIAGSGCIAEDVVASVTVSVTLHEDLGHHVIAYTYDEAGSWSTEVVLPSEFPPADYYVSATCWPVGVGQDPSIAYESASFTMVATPTPRPATPVRATPAVTG